MPKNKKRATEKQVPDNLPGAVVVDDKQNLVLKAQCDAKHDSHAFDTNAPVCRCGNTGRATYERKLALEENEALKKQMLILTDQVEQFYKLDAESRKLSKFLREHFPGNVSVASSTDTVVDVAIQILEKLVSKVTELTNRNESGMSARPNP